MIPDRPMLHPDLTGKPSEDTVGFFRSRRIMLPTFAELAHPQHIPHGIVRQLVDIDPLAPHPLNLFRVHWHNAAHSRTPAQVPEYLQLPPSLTGVRARIVVALGNRFPLIRAHKVLPAYACLVPLIVSGRFDPESQRAVWPSTGNYCRG